MLFRRRVIGSINISNNATITCISKTYNGQTQTATEITVTFKGETLTENVDYTVVENTGGTNVGSYTVKVKGIKKYSGEEQGPFLITKVTPTVVAPTAKVLTYNGSQQELVNAGSTDYGTLQYSLDDSSYSTAIPSGMNATSYTVYYKVVGDSNVNDVAAQSVSVSIAKVTPTVVAPTAKVLTYNGSQQELVNAGSTDFGTLQYKVGSESWSTSIPTRQRSGSYELSYRVVGDSNVNDVAAQTVQCSINEKPVTATVTLSQTAYTYNGSACQPTPTVKDGSTVIDPSEYSATYSNNVNAGTGTVTISDNTGGDYDVIGSATFTINKANSSLSFSVTNITVAQGETKTNVVTVNAGDGTVTYSSNNTAAVTVNNSGTITGVGAGNATITANISSTNNYNSASTSYTASCTLVLTAKFNVSSTTSPTKIVSGTSGFASIEIDGVVQPSVTTGYTFSTTGEHTVKYALNGTNIIYNAFGGCSSLTSINIPIGVTSIGNYAFQNCSGVTSIDIPSSVTSIGNSVFYGCSDLTSITVNSNNAVYDSRNSCNAIIETSSNKLIDGCQNTVIPNTVTRIGYGAFNGCFSLTNITIPSSVTNIDDYAFYLCYKLEKITLNPTTPPTLSGSYIFESTNNCPMYVSTCSLTDIYKNAWSYYKYRIMASDCPKIIAKFDIIDTTNVTRIASATTGIGCIYVDGYAQPSVITGYTFNTTGEHTVEYLLSSTGIANFTFSQCYRMKSVIIPDSVTTIGQNAFSSCSGLTSCTIGSGVTSIDNGAFRYCSGLTSIDIPDSVTTIGSNAFNACSALTTCTIGGSVRSIGAYTFTYCGNLKTIIAKPFNAPTIDKYTFQYTGMYGTLYVPKGASYEVWMYDANYFLGKYMWTKVEQ